MRFEVDDALGGSDPTRGDVGGIRSLASRVAGISAGTLAMKASLAKAVTSIDSMSSSAMTKAETAVKQMGTYSGLLHGGYDSATTALRNYATGLEGIQSDGGSIVSAVDSALGTIERDWTAVDAIKPGVTWGASYRNVPSPLTSSDVSDSITADDVTTFNKHVTSWKGAISTIDSRIRAWSALQGRRSTLDSTLSAALQSAPLAQAILVAGGGTSFNPTYAKALSSVVPSTTTIAGLKALVDSFGSMTPEQISAILRGLPESVGDQLGFAYPDQLRDVPGVPYHIRDAANVSLIHPALLKAEADLAHAKKIGLTNNGDLEDRITALKMLDTDYSNGKGRQKQPPEYIVSLDLSVSGAPLAAVSVGSLDTAKDVTYVVPGMNSSTTDYRGLVTVARNLEIDSNKETGSPTAVVAWLNYRSPDALEESGLERAEAGADRFDHDIQSFNATRAASGDDVSRLNVVAHSYGTPTVAIALANVDLHVDSFTMLASAGLPIWIENVAQLHVTNNQVFDSQDRTDGWAPVGRGTGDHPVNPEILTFGAKEFGSDGTTLPNGVDLKTAHGHTLSGGTGDGLHYLDPHTESYYNVTKIISGESSQITRMSVWTRLALYGEDSATVTFNNVAHTITDAVRAGEAAYKEARVLIDDAITVAPIVEKAVTTTVTAGVDEAKHVAHVAGDVAAATGKAVVDTAQKTVQVGENVVESGIKTGSDIVNDAEKTGEGIVKKVGGLFGWHP